MTKLPAVLAVIFPWVLLMPIASVADLVDTLRHTQLLTRPQQDELARALQPRFTEPRALARELIQRDWLTPFQINQVFQDRARDLVLGPYLLLERLGEGGMGQVFKARNRKLGLIVAIKVIRKERLTSTDALRRFRREILAAAQMSHPNVVRAFDADEIDGRYFLAMEYVEGADLGRLVKKHGPLPVAQACAYVRQAALGLQHAFERGFVHRDIKPSNLLVSGGRVSGQQGPGADHSPPTTHASPLTTHQVKILDMGLARLALGSTDAGGSSTLTEEQTVMGTPDYIAPEQARDSHAADIRSDLYSLGCTFYYLLAGQAPFPGETPMDKLLKHWCDEPQPIEHLRPDVPPGVAAIVHKLMAKTPENRFQTPVDLAVALASALKGEPAPALAGAAGAGGNGGNAADVPTDSWPATFPEQTIDDSPRPVVTEPMMPTNSDTVEGAELPPNSSTPFEFHLT